MLQKICIIITTFNRKKQTEISLAQLKRVKGEGNELWVYDDESTEYDLDFLGKYADKVFGGKNIGIEEQRRNQFLYFNGQNDFDFLYLTDNDAFHDPAWILKVEELYLKYKLPLSLYNTKVHERYTMENKEDCFIRGNLPGISIFLDKDMVNKLVKDIILRGGLFASLGGFDWRIGELFSHRVITSKESYLEHYGYSGMHSKKHENGDWAINPTEYLEKYKPSLISYFNKDKRDELIFEILNEKMFIY